MGAVESEGNGRVDEVLVDVVLSGSGWGHASERGVGVVGLHDRKVRLASREGGTDEVDDCVDEGLSLRKEGRGDDARKAEYPFLNEVNFGHGEGGSRREDGSRKNEEGRKRLADQTEVAGQSKLANTLIASADCAPLHCASRRKQLSK
jgi:hypothetical protein